MTQSIQLDARTISANANSKKGKHIVVSVAASPFYTPKEAHVSPENSFLKISFNYEKETKLGKAKEISVGDNIKAIYDTKTGRVIDLIIPHAELSKADKVLLKLEFESAYDTATETISSINTRDCNRGSLNAAFASLKAYANDFSEMAASAY